MFSLLQQLILLSFVPVLGPNFEKTYSLYIEQLCCQCRYNKLHALLLLPSYYKHSLATVVSTIHYAYYVTTLFHLHANSVCFKTRASLRLIIYASASRWLNVFLTCMPTIPAKHKFWALSLVYVIVAAELSSLRLIQRNITLLKHTKVVTIKKSGIKKRFTFLIFKYHIFVWHTTQ